LPPTHLPEINKIERPFKIDDYYNSVRQPNKIQTMKINRDILLKPSFFVGLIIAFIAAFFKISHWAGVYPLIIVGLAASLIFMITAIYEVSVSTRIEKSEKIMWIVCLILICNLAGFFYIYSGRKRII
jgi:hypothetical protein